MLGVWRVILLGAGPAAVAVVPQACANGGKDVADDRARHVHRLSSCAGPLMEPYDVVMFDLDGVLYLGSAAVSGAAEQVHRVRHRGTTVAFVTNNASRTPAQVATRLRGLGMDADPSDVVTSAQAAARLVAEQVPAGAAVLVVGGEGLEVALSEQGLRPVRSLADGPSAVVQGYSPDVAWTHLAEASYAVADGLPWVASNTDRTIPTARGLAPGNGMLVAAVAAASGGTPRVAGKPRAPLFDETVLRVGGRRPLVVGDRLDTDIEGANEVGADSLLVLTGVSGVDEVAAADPVRRPAYLAPDLRGLFVSHPPVHDEPEGTSTSRRVWRCGDWRVSVDTAGAVRVEPQRVAAEPADAVALLRAAVGAAWAWRDAGASGQPRVGDAVAGRW